MRWWQLWHGSFDECAAIALAHGQLGIERRRLHARCRAAAAARIWHSRRSRTSLPRWIGEELSGRAYVVITAPSASTPRRCGSGASTAPKPSASSAPGNATP